MSDFVFEDLYVDWYKHDKVTGIYMYNSKNTLYVLYMDTRISEKHKRARPQQCVINDNICINAKKPLHIGMISTCSLLI